MVDKIKNSSVVKLNIGCGGRPLPGYINIDSDNLLTLQARYPNQTFSSDLEIVNYDIMNLPFDENTVDEVRADSLIEHLSFSEEPQFFYEVRRVLRPGGKFDFSTTNFEKIVKLWINAVDDWKEFYRTDDEAIEKEHWFGQYSYSTENRWGYLSAMIFGSQNNSFQLLDAISHRYHLPLDHFLHLMFHFFLAPMNRCLDYRSGSLDNYYLKH